MTKMLNPATPALSALRCPKCAAEMATYERSGVVIDQCRECRGIYLDRGELERLVDAEGAAAAREAATVVRPVAYAGPAATAPSPGYRADWHDHDDRARRRDDGRGSDDGRGRDDDGWDDRRPARKRGGFLGELLEGFGD